MTRQEKKDELQVQNLVDSINEKEELDCISGVLDESFSKMEQDWRELALTERQRAYLDPRGFLMKRILEKMTVEKLKKIDSEYVKRCVLNHHSYAHSYF